MINYYKTVFNIKNTSEFNKSAIDLFNFQMKNNSIYNYYAKSILKNSLPKNIFEIPFLPISFFKTNQIICNNLSVDKIFYSSGTTGEKSKHLISDISIYVKSFTTCFKQFYGNIQDYCILALLPSYKEQTNSSLIYMIDTLIKKSKHPKSGYYLSDYSNLSNTIQTLEKNKEKTILFGVTYALLDFAEQYPQKLKHTVIIETGGMKGKRKEIIKNEVHRKLKKSFSVKNIHSEYGMTELLSQAYSKNDNIFTTPKWMKILIRDIHDPLSIIKENKIGCINIIDLANIFSCPFIATQDLGKINLNGSFSLLGRLSNSDVRGCNLLIE